MIAQKLRSEAHLQVRRNDEIAAQRSRWTFYETIKIAKCKMQIEGRKYNHLEFFILIFIICILQFILYF